MTAAARRPRRHKKVPRSEASLLYRQFVPAYELIWPLLIKKRVRDTIKELRIAPDAAVLEVGVGTGISLPAYPVHCHVTAIDLNETMLREARRKVAERGWQNVDLRIGNAEQLEFADAQFDYVVAFHLISVVSDPVQAMKEMIRVCKPGGVIVLINHFRSSNRLVSRVIDRADGLTRHFGWRTDLQWETLVAGMPITVERRYKTSPMSLFTILCLRRNAF
jgi:phosphatidylethanolamine/phosphatidyl-N-methylethanolamine N-methyltransferase